MENLEKEKAEVNHIEGSELEKVNKLIKRKSKINLIRLNNENFNVYDKII